MLERYAMLFSRFMYGLYDFEKDYTQRVRLPLLGDPAVSAQDAIFILRYLDIALEMAEVMDLESVPPLINRMIESLPTTERSYSVVRAAKDLENLRERILDQINSRYFLFIRASRLDYYQKPELFGPDVAVKFPNAIDDIEEAGKCLALDRGTAAVMHLMRVLECGLKGLALLLGIPYAPSWESYLKQIQAKISADHQSKDADWKRDEVFFRDISGDLMTIKQAWRNPTMHVGRKYSADEAEEIFRAVRTLMQHLATKIPDPLLI